MSSPAALEQVPHPIEWIRIPQWVSALAQRSARLTDPGIAVVIFMILASIYLATATYSAYQSPDPASAALSAWSMGTRGTLALNEYAGLTQWLFDVDGNVYSDRFPGTILVGIPAYWLAARLGLITGDHYSFVPAAVTGALVTSAAVAVMYLLLRQIAGRRQAVVGAALTGLATTTWAVSSNALWSHGPAQLMLSLALLFYAKRRYGLAGVACGLAIFIRPNCAIVPLVLGLTTAWSSGWFGRALRMGVPSVIALIGVLAYYRVTFGTFGFSGGYGPLVGNVVDMPVSTYLSALAGGVVGFRGVLPWSPFLVLLLPGIRAAWGQAPVWVRNAALSAVAYWLLQYRISPASGSGFFAYRFELEALTLAAPLLVLAWSHWTRCCPWRRGLFLGASTWALGLQAMGAVI